MINQLMQQYDSQIVSIYYLILFVNVILHLIFAGAVAKDAGKLHATGHKPLLVSATTWAFATLLGGTMVAAIYWFMHHSTLTRQFSPDRRT